MRYDWQKLSDDLIAGQFGSIAEAAEYLGIPYTTVHDAFGRGDLCADLVEIQTQPGMVTVGDSVSFRKSGNEATLKFKSGEPVSAKEAAEIAGVDMDEWRIVDHTVKMWQMGRKAKDVDLTWNDGVMDGYVRDKGKINKTYLYGIEVKLTRKTRVSVKATLRPIEISIPQMAHGSSLPIPDFAAKTALFICDPHFGYRRQFGNMQSIHHREFIGNLLDISKRLLPDVVIWNGDVLDLADWSSFDTEPELLYSTQLAGIELGWVLSQFRQTAKRQVLLEGNHEKRLGRMITKNLKAAFQLKPIHQLDGDPLLSVPRFLGLDKLQTEWIGNYPSASFQMGSAKFMHGDVVRKGSAKTISSMIGDSIGSKFFGHIHRHEIAQKYIEDSGHSIWLGSPGCACRKAVTPGADINHNWQLGAFVVHLDSVGEVVNVEHIKGEIDGRTWFRGRRIEASDYMPQFLTSVPEAYRNAY